MDQGSEQICQTKTSSELSSFSWRFFKSIVNLKSASLAEDPLSYKSIRVIPLIGILLSFILFNLIWIKFLAKRRWDPNNGCLL